MGGVWDCFEKIDCFATGVKKIKCLQFKNKKFVLHSVNLFEALSPVSYKGLQITQKLSCINHVDLLL